MRIAYGLFFIWKLESSTWCKEEAKKTNGKSAILCSIQRSSSFEFTWWLRTSHAYNLLVCKWRHCSFSKCAHNSQWITIAFAAQTMNTAHIGASNAFYTLHPKSKLANTIDATSATLLSYLLRKQLISIVFRIRLEKMYINICISVSFRLWILKIATRELTSHVTFNDAEQTTKIRDVNMRQQSSVPQSYYIHVYRFFSLPLSHEFFLFLFFRCFVDCGSSFVLDALDIYIIVENFAFSESIRRYVENETKFIATNLDEIHETCALCTQIHENNDSFFARSESRNSEQHWDEWMKQKENDIQNWRRNETKRNKEKHANWKVLIMAASSFVATQTNTFAAWRIQIMFSGISI